MGHVIQNLLEPYMKIYKMEDMLHNFDTQLNKGFNTLIMKYSHKRKHY